MKPTAKEKRLENYEKGLECFILFPGYESRIKLRQLISDKKIKRIITGRKLIKVKEVTSKLGIKKKKSIYKVTRRFIEFCDGERLSVSLAVFSYIKTDTETPHDFINYYA